MSDKRIRNCLTATSKRYTKRSTVKRVPQTLMRTSLACKSCREKKVKCLHDGCAPCRACKKKGLEATCELCTTREFRQRRKASIDLNNSGFDTKIELSEKIVTRSVECAARNYPELMFLNYINVDELVSSLDDLVIFSLYVLSAPFDSSLSAEDQAELHTTLEVRLVALMDDRHSLDLVNLLQALTLMIILNWQQGKTQKGYLLGGLAERAGLLLRRELNETDDFMKEEMIIRTLWSYNMTSLSLREGDLQQYKSRIHEFRLPLDNSDVLFRQASGVYFLDSLDVPSTRNIFSLFVYATDIWADCCAWIAKGGRRYYQESPWDAQSKWAGLNRKITDFESQLGPKESFKMENLSAYFALGQGHLYCYLHVVRLISKILIHRNYMPFVPTDNEGPKGPTPLSPEIKNAPSNWWKNSSHTVFDSAKEVSILLTECKKRGFHLCNTFTGFVSLTCASMLFFVHYFPTYYPEFTDAKEHYSHCLEYLVFYKNHWELGSYYYEFLEQTVDMLKAASRNKLEESSISVFENMKDELVGVANVTAPILKPKWVQIRNLVESPMPKPLHFEETEPWISEQLRDKAYSLLGWDFECNSFL